MKLAHLTIAIIVLILVGGSVFFLLGKKAVEAPAVDVTIPVPRGATETTPVTNNKKDTSNMGTYNTYQPPTAKEGVVVMPKEFTVTGKNFSFAPNTITVQKGDRVKIIFKNEDGNHDLIIDEFSVGTKLIPTGGQDFIEFTADTVGNFPYYCSIGSHRAMGMWGTLKVE